MDTAIMTSLFLTAACSEHPMGERFSAEGDISSGRRLNLSDDRYVTRDQYYTDVWTNDEAQNESVLGTIHMADSGKMNRTPYLVQGDGTVALALTAFRSRKNYAARDNNLNVCGGRCNKAYLVLYTAGDGEGYWNKLAGEGLPVFVYDDMVGNAPEYALIVSEYDIPENQDSLNLSELGAPLSIPLTLDFNQARDGSHATTFVFEYVLAREDVAVADLDSLEPAQESDGSRIDEEQNIPDGLLPADSDDYFSEEEEINFAGQEDNHSNDVSDQEENDVELEEIADADFGQGDIDESETIIAELPTIIRSTIDEQNVDPIFAEIQANVPENTVAVDWEIHDVNTGETVWQSLDDTLNLDTISLTDGNFVGELTGMNALIPQTEYDVQIRYETSDGVISDWSEPVTFTTGEVMDEVVETIPVIEDVIADEQVDLTVEAPVETAPIVDADLTSDTSSDNLSVESPVADAEISSDTTTAPVLVTDTQSSAETISTDSTNSTDLVTTTDSVTATTTRPLTI